MLTRGTRRSRRRRPEHAHVRRCRASPPATARSSRGPCGSNRRQPSSRQILDAGPQAQECPARSGCRPRTCRAGRRAGESARSACRCLPGERYASAAPTAGRMASTPVPSGPKQSLVARGGQKIDVQLVACPTASGRRFAPRRTAQARPPRAQSARPRQSAARRR